MTITVKKKIRIDQVDFLYLENFLDRIKTAAKSRYNTKYGGELSLDLNSNGNISCSYPEDETTTYLLTQVRPCFLEKDGMYYKKIIEKLQKIISQEDSKKKKKHVALLQEVVNRTEKYSKNDIFKLFTYGKFAKQDLPKHRKIKSLSPIMQKAGELNFHNALQNVFISLVALANLYCWFQKNYDFEVINDPKYNHDKLNKITFSL